MNKVQKVQFRSTPEVDARTRGGHSVTEVAKRDLQRYYLLNQQVLRTVKFTQSEAALLCDALNGVWMTDTTSPGGAKGHLVMEVGDAITVNGGAKKWGVDGDKLLAILDGLSPAQAVAVLDAVERFWVADTSRPTEEVLVEVGLLPAEDTTSDWGWSGS